MPAPSEGSSAAPATAVVGSSTPAGRAVLQRLAADGRPVLAVDAAAPDMPRGSVQVRLMDARDRLLPLALDGVRTLIHAAFSNELAASADALYGVNVGGTRNVLEAASKAGVQHLVVISSATVYGAHADNPVPLPADAPLRANPGFAYGYQRQLVEEIVADWARDHPTCTVTVLRAAPLLAPGTDHALSRILAAPRLLVPAGHTPLWQFLHPDDLAEAVDLVVQQQAGGTFNVAADGWLTTQEVATEMAVEVSPIGQTTMDQVLRAMSLAGIAPASPEALPYLSHPWVVDVSRLRALGWSPAHTNREILSDFAESVAGTVALGTLTVERAAVRRVVMTLGALVLLALWRLLRPGERS